MKTFGAFLKWTKMCDETWSMIKGKSPIGALGLTTAAIQALFGFPFYTF
jgi:hypothetical protein